MDIPFGDVNIWAVLVAVILNMILGALWYSPLLFGKPWIRLAGIDEQKAKKEMVPAIMEGLISSLVASYFFALSFIMVGIVSISHGIIFAVVMWLALIVPMELDEVAFERRSIELCAINVAYALLRLIIIATVILGWPW